MQKMNYIAPNFLLKSLYTNHHPSNIIDLMPHSEFSLSQLNEEEIFLKTRPFQIESHGEQS